MTDSFFGPVLSGAAARDRAVAEVVAVLDPVTRRRVALHGDGGDVAATVASRFDVSPCDDDWHVVIQHVVDGVLDRDYPSVVVTQADVTHVCWTAIAAWAVMDAAGLPWTVTDLVRLVSAGLSPAPSRSKTKRWFR